MRDHKAGARPAAAPTHIRALLCCLLVLCAAVAAAAQQRPTLVSVNSAGTGTGNRRSDGPYRTSADGRCVVLRRDPDAADFRGVPDPGFEGYLFWLGKLNEHHGNFVNAEMVRAFIESIEYGERFGQ